MKCVITSVFSVSLILLPSLAQATLVTYTVDPTQSSIALTGQLFGPPYSAAPIPYGPQAAGSMTTSWGGTITADLTGSVLTFTGGSVIKANANPVGPFSTAPNGPANHGLNNYGVTLSGTTIFGPITVNGAYRDLQLDITAGTATNGAAPAGMSLKFGGSSVLDYGSTNASLFGTSNLGGSGANTTASLAVVSPSILTLPITFQTTGGTGRVENWSGVLVATAVPEPTAGLFLLVAAGAVYVGRRLFAKKHSDVA